MQIITRLAEWNVLLNNGATNNRTVPEPQNAQAVSFVDSFAGHAHPACNQMHAQRALCDTRNKTVPPLLAAPYMQLVNAFYRPDAIFWVSSVSWCMQALAEGWCSFAYLCWGFH